MGKVTQHQTSKMLLRALALTLLVSLARGEELVEADHQAKAFSLFNVVTFKNLDCESTSTSSTNGQRNGTCYTSEECDEKGGVASGSWAMGFGTCCLFTFQTCGTDVKQNCSYVRNEGFPTLIGGASSTASTCNYKIEKCDPKVCTLRLDFESFTLLAGTGTLEADGTCQDTFNVNGLTAGFSQIPTICGANTGEHIYVEVGPGATDSGTLAPLAPLEPSTSPMMMRAIWPINNTAFVSDKKPVSVVTNTAFALMPTLSPFSSTILLPLWPTLVVLMTSF